MTTSTGPARHVAFLDAELGGAPAADLKHHGDGFARRQRTLVERLRMRDAHDRSVASDEDDIQRDQGVLHPEGHVLRWIVRKDHSPVAGKRLHEHQAAFLLLGGRGDLHNELMRRGTASDAQRHFAEPRLRSGLSGVAGRVLRRRGWAAGEQPSESNS